MSVIHTGLLSAPQGLGMALVMPLAGNLVNRYGGGLLALIGVTVTTIFTVPLALVGAHTSIVLLSVTMFLRGTGIGVRVRADHDRRIRIASTALSSPMPTPQLNVLMRVGGSIGTAILAVVLERATVGAHSPSAAAAGFGSAFWWALGMTALAVIPCFLLMQAERRARATVAGAEAEREAIKTRRRCRGDRMNEAEHSVAAAFKAVNIAMRRMRGRQTHDQHSLSYAQWGLLVALEGGGALSARHLGQAASLSPASVTQMLEGLEANGLVARSRCADDRRVNPDRAHGARSVSARRASRPDGPRLDRSPRELRRGRVAHGCRMLSSLAECFTRLADDPEEALRGLRHCACWYDQVA